MLHAQIEQLRAGRERLAETMTDVKHSVEAIADDLFKAEDEARMAAEVAGREAAARPDDEEPPRSWPPPAGGRGRGGRAGGAGGGGVDAVPSPTHPCPRRPRPRVPVARRPGPRTAPRRRTPVEQVDALFAKLRAAQDDTGTAAATAPAGRPPPDRWGRGTRRYRRTWATARRATARREARNPQAVRRDDLVTPIVTGMARRLKRALQDNQNDLLDRLRAKGTTWSAACCPTRPSRSTRSPRPPCRCWRRPPTPAPPSSAADGPRPSADVLIAIAHELAESVVGPLRRRLAGGDGLDAAEESVVTEHIGSAFREWKGERIERLAGDHVVAAFSLGTPGRRRLRRDRRSSGWPWPARARRRAPTARTTA